MKDMWPVSTDVRDCMLRISEIYLQIYNRNI